ncbi:hypothetical protein GCM10009832_30480 [Dietzia kunjamensis subsp. schimae]
MPGVEQVLDAMLTVDPTYDTDRGVDVLYPDGTGAHWGRTRGGRVVGLDRKGRL